MAPRSRTGTKVPLPRRNPFRRFGRGPGDPEPDDIAKEIARSHLRRGLFRLRNRGKPDKRNRPEQGYLDRAGYKEREA